MEADEIFTIDEMAQKLKVDRFFLYRHIKSGHLPCHRIGRSIRFTGGDFKEILARSACEGVK